MAIAVTATATATATATHGLITSSRSVLIATVASKLNRSGHGCRSLRIQNPFQISRRDASLFSLIPLISPILLPPPPAAAFSIGISGPKDWLKEQKKKASKYLLAPIDASRENLRSAYMLLVNEGSSARGKDLEEFHRLLASAARDCVPQERNSFVAFQANTGVEVCTFRLVVKNASSLLDNKDPVKLRAESMLNDLIRSFSSLTILVNENNVQVASSRQKVADALKNTINSLDKFEQGVKDCLEV